MKPYNTYNKPCFKTANLDYNVKNLLQQKVAQIVTISLANFIFSKSHNGHPKVAQTTKYCPIWSPCSTWSQLIFTVKVHLQWSKYRRQKRKLPFQQLDLPWFLGLYDITRNHPVYKAGKSTEGEGSVQFTSLY